MSLVPTRVGMILGEFVTADVEKACPHTRGDDPECIVTFGTLFHLSPHAWG